MKTLLQRRAIRASNSTVKSCFTILTTCLVLCFTSSVWGYQYPEGRATVFEYPPTTESIHQLIDTQRLINFLNDTYAVQIQQKHDARFVWKFEWDKNHLAAGSNIYEQEASIMLWGGFVRAPGSSFSLIALTLCHEVGHFLGGSPRQHFNNDPEEHWSSAEGQSDWFAAKECLPLIYTQFKNEIGDVNSPNTVCHQTQSPSQCHWISSAGQEFTDFSFYYFGGNSVKKATIGQSATERPEKTLINTYPSDQCRLDTYKAGALCSAGLDKYCQRPRCWFAD